MPVRTAMSFAATLLAVTAAATVPAAAGESKARLSVGDGTLSAEGAAVRVPVSFSCPEGWRYSVGLEMVQNVREGLARGYAQAEGVCAGKWEERTFYVQAAGDGVDARPFRTGPASGQTRLNAQEVPEQPPVMVPYVLCPMGICYPGAILTPQQQPRWAQAVQEGTIRLQD